MKPAIFFTALALLIVATFITALRISLRRDDKIQPESPLRKPISGAMQALEFFAASRAYPNSEMPDEGYYSAYLFSKSLLKTNHTLDRSISEWRSLGPQNLGGRTNAIAINPLNPNTIYVGAASGGLWKTTTAGLGVAPWQYVDTGFPVLGVNAIAIDPADTNVIYIGTGEVYRYQNSIGGVTVRTTRGSYGIGILKTTDAGATWSKSLDWTYNQRRGVQQISIDPLNTHIVYAATTEGSYKSTDAGSTWNRVHNVRMAVDVDINPANPNIVFVACGNVGSPDQAAVYRSINAGVSWEKLVAGLPTGYTGKTIIDLHRADPNIIYAHVANTFNSVGIYRSADGGNNWEKMSAVDIARYQGWYSHYVAAHPRDPQIVFAGGIELWKSTDGGRTFVKKSNEPQRPNDYLHVDQHAMAFHPTNPDLIYFTNDGGVFRTADGGETFASLNRGYTTTQFYNGFSCAATDSQLALGGLQDNSTALFTGSSSWRLVIGGDGAWTAIDPVDHNIMYGEYYYLSILKSVNRGASWFDAVNGLPSYNERTSTANFIAPFILSPSNRNILYGGTDRVYKSTDAAASWFPTGNNRPLDGGNRLLALAMSATNPDLVFAATSPDRSRPRIFRTTNGGLTWEDVTGNLPDRFPMDIAVDPANDQIVYLVFSGFGASHLFKSTNAGLSWTDIGTGLPDVPSSAVTIDPLFPQHAYFGNDLGVYVSLDGGGTWQEWSEGMPAALVMDLTISPSNRALRAATHGNGVWERPLIGSAVSVQEPMAPVVSHRLHQNYPNPFHLSRNGSAAATTTIPYELSEAGEISLIVYNALGQEVVKLVEGKKSSGHHEIRFDGKGLSSGVYIYTLRAGDVVRSRKMLVLE